MDTEKLAEAKELAGALVVRTESCRKYWQYRHNWKDKHPHVLAREHLSEMERRARELKALLLSID